ncbi:cytochrome P450 [Novosphingobium album (ex Hu et al. 2023)]|uniref:Cytochrome P450 n=1 Tax=Novosphingobium album (ex Hu et al. 2023) TaxID=2930093 RepID=A0ABT0B7H0_9SPHN|nr:cytochrome P450 [Novosphingobium album (ex Hu et al. 2023)]MCJ2181025.1 cytochrome P450 [Novosphingobium album (ex Hu et al. 2023)]
MPKQANPQHPSRHTAPTRIDSLDLQHLAWDSAEFSADPYSRFEAARAVHPWLAKVDGGYVVFDLKAIRDLLVLDDQFRTSFDGVVEIMGAQDTAWGRFAQEQMIALPEREQMQRRLDEWTSKGQFDFEEFASYYPVSVMARMIGAPLDATPGLRSAMEVLGLAFSLDSRLLPDLDRAMAELDAFSFRLIAERRAEPRSQDKIEPDLLDLLLEAGSEHSITDRQLAELLIFLFVAGYDTSKNVLTYMMHVLIRHPQSYERCATDMDYCRKVVEETLRMFTPAFTFRATKEDMVYRDVLIPKGTMIFFALNVAGRISAQIEHSCDFDPERTIRADQRHVGFGLGKHMCLGQYIARAQLQEALHLIAQHLLQPRESAPPGWRPFPGNWGIKGLPIEFEPAAS